MNKKPTSQEKAIELLQQENKKLRLKLQEHKTKEEQKIGSLKKELELKTKELLFLQEKHSTFKNEMKQELVSIQKMSQLLRKRLYEQFHFFSSRGILNHNKGSSTNHNSYYPTSVSSTNKLAQPKDKEILGSFSEEQEIDSFLKSKSMSISFAEETNDHINEQPTSSEVQSFQSLDRLNPQLQFQETENSNKFSFNQSNNFTEEEKLQKEQQFLTRVQNLRKKLKQKKAQQKQIHDEVERQIGQHNFLKSEVENEEKLINTIEIEKVSILEDLNQLLENESGNSSSNIKPKHYKNSNFQTELELLKKKLEQNFENTNIN
ncbi:hypothetical protein M0812_24205 [Anaeramoeba flamelloides]|uniref:Uncharacterized protein n=1 Tax=Anaeramoeba flamelloides TaxID=1746091 RepID=A0AAV7YIU5_9EUKA|nr:hypothetical protein M0812_24205 [Anaeramoeba flamelloides]